MLERKRLWDISIFEVEMTDYHLIKDDLISFIYDYDSKLEPGEGGYGKGIGPHKQLHKYNLSESHGDLFLSENEALQKLNTFCGQSLADLMHQLNGKYYDTNTWGVDFHDSWYHITKDGGYHDVHHHGKSAWCGIFYVDIGDSSTYNANGINRFYSPLAIDTTIGLEYIQHHAYDVTPVSGKLVMFPGFLKHSAVPYHGDKDRIVVSFNANLEVPEDSKLVGRSEPRVGRHK